MAVTVAQAVATRVVQVLRVLLQARALLTAVVVVVQSALVAVVQVALAAVVRAEAPLVALQLREPLTVVAAVAVVVRLVAQLARLAVRALFTLNMQRLQQLVLQLPQRLEPLAPSVQTHYGHF
jgi:hypothetical protein